MFEAAALVATHALAGLIGWHIRDRGVKGIISELEDVKTDVANLKAKL